MEIGLGVLVREEIKIKISGIFFWNREKKLGSYISGINSDVSNGRAEFMDRRL